MVSKGSLYDILSNEALWKTTWFVANAILLGRRGYIYYKDSTSTELKKFCLRANSITYITLWGVFSLITTVLGCLYVAKTADIGEVVDQAGVMAAEFIAICLWSHYFGNGALLKSLVAESKSRMKNLSVDGLGMNKTERGQLDLEIENALVAFWNKALMKKRWTAYSKEKRQAMLFDSGFECGKVLEDKFWEGILHDVAAYFHEWKAYVEGQNGAIRIPSRCAQSMIRGHDSGLQSLLCVAIIVANEDKSLREERPPCDLAGRQFSAARIARRKAAAEGILRWPDAMAEISSFQVPHMHLDVGLLKERSSTEYGESSTAVKNCNYLPVSVQYTITEAIKAGYLRSNSGIIDAQVTFKYGNMVFKKDEWNSLRHIQRKPFRYITSATWMSGDPAFVVEQREISGLEAMRDGSGWLEGVLRIRTEVAELPETESWIDRSLKQGDADQEPYWKEFTLPETEQIHPLNWPMMGAIRMAWTLVLWGSGFVNWLKEKNSDRTLVNLARSSVHRTVQSVARGVGFLMTESKRAADCKVYKKMAQTLKHSVTYIRSGGETSEQSHVEMV